MDEQLQQFVNNYMYLANTRNVSYDNPVTMELQPDARTFLMVVSYSEPSFSQLPYNVLWICYDDQDPWHAKIYRRVDHNQSADPTHIGKKYTWLELTTYDQLYDEDQYFQAVDETPANEIGASWANVVSATEEVGGLVVVTDDAQDGEPVAITDSDPRNSDAREPTAHVHPDYPRTMVHIKGFYSPDVSQADLVNDDEYFVSIDPSQVPEPGSMFFLTGQNPQRPNEWYGEWRLPTEDDIWVPETHITSVNVRIASGETTVSDNSTITMGANSVYDDASVIVDDPTTVWSISANAGGVTIHPTSGVLSIPDLSGDLLVTITATCSDKYWPGETAVGTMDVNIRDLFQEKVLMSLTILGLDSIQEQTSTDYTVQADFNDGSTEIVTPDSFVGDNATAGTLSGLTLTGQDISTNEVVTLTATYTHNGSTLNTNKSVTVIADVVPVSLDILGPSAMNELDNINLQAQVTYSDGSTSVLNIADASWGFQSAPNDIDVTPGLDVVNYESTADIDGDDTFVVTVDATVDGQALSATKNITVVDTTVPKIPQSLAISGPTQIAEQSSGAEYTFEVTYTDTTTAVVNADAGSFTTSNTVLSTVTDLQVDGSSNVIRGQLDANTDITSNESVTLSASYTENGTTVNANLPVTIVADPPAAVSIEITGPTEMDEETSIDLTATVTFDDASTLVVSGSSSLYPCTWSYVQAATGITDSENTSTQTFTSGADIPSDEVFETRVECTIDGNTVTDTHTVALNDVPVVPNSIEIIGPTSLNEGTSENYTFRVTYSDSSTQDISPVDIAEVDNTLAASITDTGELTASLVTADTPIEITIQTLIDGVTLSDTFNVNIIDVPVPETLTIVGQDTVSENGNFNYSFEVGYTDGSTVTVPAVDNASSDNGNTTFGVNGALTTSDIGTSDSSAILSADIVHEGVALTATLNITITAEPIPVSLAIIGTATVNENTSHTYNVEVTMSDSSTKIVVPSSFTSDNVDASVTDIPTGAVSYSEVASDTLVTLTAGYEEQGIPLTATLDVTITDIVIPVSLTIAGPATLDEGSTETYTFEVTMSDSSTKFITPDTQSATLGSLASNGSYNAPANVNSDTGVQLNASYIENGETVNDTFDITVVNANNRVSSLEVTGALNMDEGGATTQLVATASYEDGTTAVVSAPSTWTIDSGSGATIDQNGLVTSNANVTTNSPITFKASYTEGGITVEDTHLLVVENINNLPVSLEITGATNVQEGGGNVNLVATVTLESNNTSNVTAESTWSITSGASAGSVSTSGVFTPAADVASDTVVTIEASYTDKGETVTDTHTITVTDIPVPQSVSITGGTQVDEGAGTVSLNAVMTRTDTSNQNVTNNANSTWSVTSGPGSVSSAGVYTPPADVASDTVATVQISYTESGVTVTDTHNITVKNQVASGYGPRWGVVPEVNNLADYNDAFMGSLSNNLNGTDNETFASTPSSSNYLYIAVPDSLGWLQLLEEGTGNPGGFDGATDLANENNFSHDDGAGDSVANSGQVYLYAGSTNTGGLRVEIGGQGYRIYRKVTTRNTPYNVTVQKYNAVDRKSQFA